MMSYVIQRDVCLINGTLFFLKTLQLCFMECQLGHHSFYILNLCSCVKSSELYLCGTLQKLTGLYVLRRGMREQNSKAK
jgi:hypothetical protein